MLNTGVLSSLWSQTAIAQRPGSWRTTSGVYVEGDALLCAAPGCLGVPHLAEMKILLVTGLALVATCMTGPPWSARGKAKALRVALQRKNHLLKIPMFVTLLWACSLPS